MRKFFGVFILTLCVVFGNYAGLKGFSNDTKSCELVEQTLVIIKPEAVANNQIGKILEAFEADGLTIIGLKMTQLSKEDAESFYKIHKKRNFYASLVKYMSSGPIVPLTLEGRDAVVKVRKIVGDTDPKVADKNTIREKFGTNIQKNAVHASDSKKNAIAEIKFFFSWGELYSPCAREVFKN